MNSSETDWPSGAWMCLPQLRLSPYLATARAVAQPRRMSGAASEAAELRHPILQLALWSLPAPQLHEPSEQSTALEMSSSCTVPTERVIGAEPEAQISRSSAPWPD